MQDSYWNELLPRALMCGMTPTQFWYDEPRLIHSYLCKHEQVLDEENYKSWLIGLYVYNAVATVMANSFSKDSKLKYAEKPLEELNASYRPKEKFEFRETVNYWSKFKKNKKKGGKK